MLETILSDVAKHLNLHALKGSNQFEGGFTLKISDQFEVWVKDLNPGVFIRGIITPLPGKEDRESLFMHLMRANFLGQGTGGAAIGIDPDEKFLTLSLSILYEVNYRIFRDRLEDFINYLDYWKEYINKLGAGQV